MKILSFQPYSLYFNGGGNRILRRLFKGHETKIVSLAAESFFYSKTSGPIAETVVYAVPMLRPWMRWRLKSLVIWLRSGLLKSITVRKIRRAADDIEYDILHVVQHGPYSTALCAKRGQRPLWVAFHDHFSTTRTNMGDAKLLWQSADRRLVISPELASCYCELFGDRSFEIITDGVEANELSTPRVAEHRPLIVYFSGLLHLDYLPLFHTLAASMDRLAGEVEFKLVLRGTQRVQALENRSFTLEYREVTLDEDLLKREIDEADILYLPMKFTVADFYRYSLSTKMVGYLGGESAILYHGPADCACCRLLKAYGAAEICNSQNPGELGGAITRLIGSKAEISNRAKSLALEKFDMKSIRERFWQTTHTDR